MNDRLDLIPAALLCHGIQRPPGRGPVHGGTAPGAQDYAKKNGYVVAREYVDEAESGRIADRPQ